MCVCKYIDSYNKRAEEIQGQNSQLMLYFIKPDGPVSTPVISRWIIIFQDLPGIDNKGLTG